MYANHPSIAKEFEAATPKGKKLPYHVKKTSKGLGKKASLAGLEEALGLVRVS